MTALPKEDRQSASLQRTLHEESPMRIGELAGYMGMGKPAIYQDVATGYVFEFATHKLTTPRHYKAWLRIQTAEMIERQTTVTRVDRARLDAELSRLRS